MKNKVIEQYLEMDCFEGLDCRMVLEEVGKDSHCRKILSTVWKFEEEEKLQSKKPGTPEEKLEMYVNLTRKIQGKDSEAYRIWAWWAFGVPTVSEREQQSFRDDNEIKAKVVVLDLLYQFIEYSSKLNEISKALGLESIGPFARGRQVSGWSKGGKERAKTQTPGKVELKKKSKHLFLEIKSQNKGMSNNSVDKRVASRLGISSSYVYQLRTDRK